MKIVIALLLSFGVFAVAYKISTPKTFHEPITVHTFSLPEPQPQVLAAETKKVDCPNLNALDILIDKFHGLPQDYEPTDLVNVGEFKLRNEATNQLNKMLGAMGQINMFLPITSAYRSAVDQAKLFKPGDLKSAQPGFSEHQLGTAVDFSLTYPSKQWTWLDKNAHKYGFVMSYRYNQTVQSGYNFEPWHWRYVGVKLAAQIRNSPKLPQTFYRPIICN